MVVGVRLVNAEGDVEHVTEEGDPYRMRLIRSSYGLAGIIFEVTFRIQKESVLSYRYKILDLTVFPAGTG
jgi:FAD/FMN-containing dehydrogenase